MKGLQLLLALIQRCFVDRLKVKQNHLVFNRILTEKRLNIILKLN